MFLDTPMLAILPLKNKYATERQQKGKMQDKGWQEWQWSNQLLDKT